MNFQTEEQNLTERESTGLFGQAIGRRSLLAGGAGLGLAGLLGLGAAFAQDADPTATDEETVTTDDDEAEVNDDTDMDAEVGAAYQNFLGKLTTNLGMTDTAQVDLAIRSSLKAMVDEKFSDGSISQNDADALKDRIDNGASPIGVAMLGGMRGRGMERRRKRREDAGIGGDTLPADDSTDATPTT